ncbi:MAG: flagellar export protein FliJ [Stygiobacter sp.]|jgi:flagellar FliJ protein|uniref:Flagellar FliJ protein n=1 Tax=Stygiobacter electus TaxID=3032292 RepID=A0AAE3NUP3_9BACT|nr:flagellar export protein FliJ [Stygiobacter electus]MDF1611261.1 flagellar export protein FliJ [Stygiobacter electus]
MAKYKFKFESILRIKEVLEKKTKEEISIINLEIENLKKQKEFLIQERNKVLSKMTEQMLKVSDYQSIKMYDNHLEQELIHIEKKIVEAYKTLEKKQKELIEKKKEVKSFEILKENDKENFLIEEKRRELKTLNEIAIRNFDGDK